MHYLSLQNFKKPYFQDFEGAEWLQKVLPTGKTTMAEIKRNCLYRDDFTAELFEQEPLI